MNGGVTMGVKITGLNKLKKQVKQMERGAKELKNTKSVSFDELFTTSFMSKYTTFSSFNDLLLAGNFKVESNDDFEEIPENELDIHVSNTTKFDNWEEMLGTATEEFAFKKLGL